MATGTSQAGVPQESNELFLVKLATPSFLLQPIPVTQCNAPSVVPPYHNVSKNPS